MAELVLMRDEDISRCVDIYFNAFDMFRTEIVDSSYMDKIIKQHEGYFSKCINEKGRYAVCMENDGVIVGFITAWDVPSMCGGYDVYIDVVAVDPEYQGNGFGKAMLNGFIEGFSEETDISLVTRKSSPAYKLYSSSGFEDMNTTRMIRSPQLISVREKINELEREIASQNKEMGELVRKISGMPEKIKEGRGSN